jgi:hypothetical protein
MNMSQRNSASAALAVAAFITSVSALSITPSTVATAFGNENNTADFNVAIALFLGSPCLRGSRAFRAVRRDA